MSFLSSTIHAPLFAPSAMGRSAASPLTRTYDSGIYQADLFSQEKPMDCEMALKVLMFQTARIQRQLNLMTLLAAALLALLVLSK